MHCPHEHNPLRNKAKRFISEGRMDEALQLLLTRPIDSVDFKEAIPVARHQEAYSELTSMAAETGRDRLQQKAFAAINKHKGSRKAPRQLYSPCFGAG